MEVKKYVRCEGYFSHEGKAKECKIVKEKIIRNEDDSLTYILTAEHNGETYEISPDEFFEDVESYERNIRFYKDSMKYRVTQLLGTSTFYYVEDGQIKKFDIDDEWRTIVLENGKCTCLEAPENSYTDEYEAIAYNTVSIVDQNGVETEKVGINLLLRLTDAQRAIVTEIEALFVKAKEAGIKFFYDTDSQTNYALSTLNVEKLLSSYENDENGEDAPVWKSKEFMVNIDIIPSYSDDRIWAVRKSEPQS